MAKRGGDKAPTIVIRKIEGGGAGHHGGAWKVAYADFVTAMMAFFLLMWLLNATTDEQRRGLADYFSPSATLNHGASASGAPFGGHTPYDDGPAVSDRGAIAVMNANAPPVDADDDETSETIAVKVLHNDAKNGQSANATGTGGAGPNHTPSGTPSRAELRSQLRRLEQQAFAQAASDLHQAIAADPKLAALAGQLAIDMTPEGLRVQIRDADRQPMFATGSADPNDQARALVRQIAPVLLRLTQKITIAGYTDAAPYAGQDRTNWELSADRANATRRLLIDAGLPEARIASVSGHADRDLLLPDQPLAAANRRIAIVVLREAAGAKRE